VTRQDDLGVRIQFQLGRDRSIDQAYFLHVHRSLVVCDLRRFV
jgi:hypothetical protein